MNEAKPNMHLWDIVSRVPPEHLKSFQRAGGFSGTAIKPMWSIRTMTEQFGVCGQSWGIDEPKFTVHPVGNEILVYCTVSVWIEKREHKVFGVGGDKVFAVFKSGTRSDDEAFKKAYTDAITNALKLLGVGADIHMGLWDGNKYIDDEGLSADPDQAVAAGLLPSIHNEPKANSRDVYHELVKEIRDIASLAALNTWKTNPANIARMTNLNDDFADAFRNEFSDHVRSLKAKAAL